jgi:energy-coupling factor transport system permease protein
MPRIKGAPFESPKIFIRLKSYLSILIPLFEAFLVRAADLAEAMDSRCYTHHPNQVRMSRLRLKHRDFLSMLLMFTVLFLGLVAQMILEV